jgi:hypothetical protein
LSRKHVRNEGSRRFKSVPLRQPVCTFYLHFGEGGHSARNVGFFLPQRIGKSRLPPDSSGWDGVTFPITKPMVGIGNASARALRRKACIKPTSESFLVARSGEPRFQRLPSHRFTLPACTKQTAGAFVTNAGVKIPVMLCSLIDDDGLSSPSWRSCALARSART